MSSLKSNFLANQMLEALSFQSKAASRDALCDICEGDDTVTHICKECPCFLCTICASLHSRAKATRKHQLFPIQEAETINPCEFTANARSNFNYCLKHDDELLKLYCETCKEVICRDCTVIDHKGHQYSFVKEIAKQRKVELNGIMKKSKELLLATEHADQDIHKMIEKIKNRQSKVKIEIKEAYDKIIKVVNDHIQDLFKKVDEIAEKKSKALDMQSSNASLLSDAISFVENMLKHCGDIEVMQMATSFQKRLEDLCDSLSDVSPVEGDQINPELNDNSFETIRTAIHNYIPSVNGHSFDPEQCLVTINEHQINLGQKVSFKIVAKMKEGVTCGSQYDQVLVHLQETRHENYAVNMYYGSRYRTGTCPNSNVEMQCQVHKTKSHSIFNGETRPLTCQTNHHLILSVNNIRYIRKIFKWNQQQNGFDVESTVQKK